MTFDTLQHTEIQDGNRGDGHLPSVNPNKAIHAALASAIEMIQPEAWAYTLMQMDLISGYLQFTVAIGVVEALKDGPQPIEGIASMCDVKNVRYLRQVMRDLANWGFYEEREGDTFANNKASSTFLQNQHASYWPYLKWVEACRKLFFDGITYTTLHKKLADMEDVGLFHVATQASGTDEIRPSWKYLREDQELARIMDNSMEQAPTHIAIIESVADNYDFSSISTLVEVAGGTGRLVNAILAKYEKKQGVLFDLEDVTKYAQTKPHFIHARCRTTNGSHLVHIPKLGDGVILSGIIQSYDDDDATRILGNCARSLESGQKVILIDCLADPNELNWPMSIKSAQMLAFHGPGLEGCSPGVRRREDFYRLFDRSGMDLQIPIPLTNPPGHYILEGIVR